MPAPSPIRTTVFRGLPWSLQFTMSSTDVDFSTAEISAQVRVAEYAASLATATIEITAAEVGSADCLASLTAEQTAALPDRCVMDVIAGVLDSGIYPDVLLRIELTVERHY